MNTRTAVRWGARAVAGLLALVGVTAAAGYGFSEARMAHRFSVPDHPLVIRGDSAEIARGQRLATVRGCVDCHGANLGGRLMFDDPAIGHLAAPNLTTGGRGAELETRDFERAIRHGVRRDGTGLRVMPAAEFTTMADDELEAIVSYVESVPAVKAPPTTSSVGPVIRALFLAGQVKLLAAEEIDHARAHPAHVEPSPTAEYGKYLAIGCTGCHGPTFSGGKIPGAPPDWKPAANITPTGIGRYSEDDFAHILRTGKRPDGTPVDSLMPWRLTRAMTDTEVSALYAYLKTVKPKAYGGR